MPHSPYRITISAPIKDLDFYRQELRQSRARWECDAEDRYEMIEPLLDNGDTLIEQCEFLETKLDFKVREYLDYGTVSRNSNGSCLCPM